MKINRIEPTTYKANIRIKSIENKSHPFLYNEILDITREVGVPANFRTNYIELPSASSMILAKLKQLGIIFGEKLEQEEKKAGKAE